ncbi:MAG: helix-turn-helix domain-containing protein [Pseudomonadota bacterium]
MTTWYYPAKFERFPEGEIVVTFPDVPEAVTGAFDEREAMGLAEDVLEEAILGRLAQGEDIPTPRGIASGEIAIPLDPTTAARVLLRHTMAAQRVSKTALAARLGQSEGAVRRLVDGVTRVKLETVLAALQALGVRAALTTLP